MTLPSAMRMGQTLLHSPLMHRIPSHPSNFLLPLIPIHYYRVRHAKLPGKIDDAIPPYPYGPEINFKEADQGLYGGVRPQTGNKVSKGRNKGKTRRKWLPNIRIEEIRSEALDRTIPIKVTKRCMRTIRKCGGLDQYLLGDKPARIKELGLFGWQLRWQVFQTPKIQKQLAEERKELGLPEKSTVPVSNTVEDFNVVWQEDEQLRQQVQEEQKKQWRALWEKDQRVQRHLKSRWDKAEPENVVPASFDVQAFNKI